MANRKHKPKVDKFTKTRHTANHKEYQYLHLPLNNARFYVTDAYITISALTRSGIITLDRKNRYSRIYKVKKGHVEQCLKFGFRKY